MFDYIADGQITIFDYIEPEHKFAPVIDDLSTELSNLFTNNDYSEEYEVWDHVPYLGYRYMFNTSVNKLEYLEFISKLEEIKKKFKKHHLEITAAQTPCIKTKDNINVYVFTLWEDKHRAKNG